MQTLALIFLPGLGQNFLLSVLGTWFSHFEDPLGCTLTSSLLCQQTAVVLFSLEMPNET